MVTRAALVLARQRAAAARERSHPHQPAPPVPVVDELASKVAAWQREAQRRAFLCDDAGAREAAEKAALYAYHLRCYQSRGGP
jgi:hypothetical protein